MNSDCGWFDSRLEAYFSQDLSQEELAACERHLAACPDCREQVQSLRGIDPVVKQVLQLRLARARQGAPAPRRAGLPRLALAGSGVIAAGILAFAIFVLPEEPSFETGSQTAEVIQPAAGIGDSSEKSTQPEEIRRLSPQPPPVGPALPQPGLDAPLGDGMADFAVIDAAGYTATLETYRGKILLFGVVTSEEDRAVENLQRIYERSGSNPQIRILGIARRQDKLEGAAFPIMYNLKSGLFGAQPGEFVLVDTEGNLRLQGSLTDAASVNRIEGELQQLAVR